MDQGPLVREEIDAGAEMAREFDKYQPVKVAFWLKESDNEYRYLYIASEGIDGTSTGYGEVVRLMNKMQSPYFDLFRVKLIGADNPLAKAAIEINVRFPNRMGNHLRGTMFGGVFVDDVYIYPSPLPVAVH